MINKMPKPGELPSGRPEKGEQGIKSIKSIKKRLNDMALEAGGQAPTKEAVQTTHTMTCPSCGKSYKLEE